MEGQADGVNSYLTEEIERHRREQPDDLITAMLGMPEMSDAEVRSAAILLFIAGYDTTAKLMGMSLVALELHPISAGCWRTTYRLSLTASKKYCVGQACRK